MTAMMDHQTPLSVIADPRGRVGKGPPRGELRLELLAALPGHLHLSLARRRGQQLLIGKNRELGRIHDFLDEAVIS